jgi:hypothetical protein
MKENKGFASQDLTHGQTNALVKLVGGEKVVRMLLNKEISFQIFPGSNRFPIWRTIELGLANDAESYLVRLQQSDMIVEARCLLKNHCNDISSESKELDLVVVSTIDLGFAPVEQPPYNVVCATAIELGLRLLPPEAGPALRLQYRDQPAGERLYIGMEGRYKYGHTGFLLMFMVCNEAKEDEPDKFVLEDGTAHPVRLCKSDMRIVFERPRS